MSPPELAQHDIDHGIDICDIHLAVSIHVANNLGTGIDARHFVDQLHSLAAGIVGLMSAHDVAQPQLVRAAEVARGLDGDLDEFAAGAADGA